MITSRRALLGGVAGLTASPGGVLGAAFGEAGLSSAEKMPFPSTRVTSTLAAYLVEARYEDLPSGVRKEATRTLLNWMGAAIGGSRSRATEIAVASTSAFFGAGQATLIGREGKADVLNCALINGISGHVLDFDDDHLKTIIHPAAPVMPALLALAEYRKTSGRDFLTALVLGMETELRIGNAVYPNHYDAGWHITGSCGVFGAAAACGKLLGLDRQAMAWAIGLAASQPVGLRESFGSMNKSFNPARAASNGLLSALLASRGFTSSDDMLEAKAGWAQTISTKWDWQQVTDRLGERFEAALNTYKPFACGIVMHPGIEAAIRFHRRGIQTTDVSSVELIANPLVLTLTGKLEPRTGLEGKFSIYHAIAIALIDGDAGVKQFSDAAVDRPDTIALRRRIRVVPDTKIGKDQAVLVLRLTNGRETSESVHHAIGSEERPMTDADLQAKLDSLAAGILPPDTIGRLKHLCLNVADLDDVSLLAATAGLRSMHADVRDDQNGILPP